MRHRPPCGRLTQGEEANGGRGRPGEASRATPRSIVGSVRGRRYRAGMAFVPAPRPALGPGPFGPAEVLDPRSLTALGSEVAARKRAGDTRRASWPV